MTSDNRNDLGRIIKQKRVMISMTLRELTAASGVSTSHLGRIERGERFPSARTLRKIAKPLGFTEAELFRHAGYLTPQASTTESETRTGIVDPCVASLLAQEPVEVQRTVIRILAILKSLARVGNPAGWPEYARRKYPDLDEDLITMIEDLITRSVQTGALGVVGLSGRASKKGKKGASSNPSHDRSPGSSRA